MTDAPEATCPCCNQKVDPLRVLFDEGTGLVSHRGKSQKLNPSQSSLLRLFLDAYPRAMSKEALFDARYWNRADNETPSVRVIDTLICHLRRRLDPLGLIIETAWGRGYRLALADPASASLLREETFSIHGAMPRLTDEQSSHLRDLRKRGMTVTQIAAVMKLPYGTIERHVKRSEAAT